MRALPIVAVLASTAVAAPKSPHEVVRAALASRATLVAALADSVELGGLMFDDDACNARFGQPGKTKRDDREALADCLRGANVDLFAAYSSSAIQLRDGHHWLYEVSLRGGRIAAIGIPAGQPDEAHLPTMLASVIDFEPSDRVKRKKTGDNGSVFKRCHDVSGAITVRRLVESSGLPAYDKEALAVISKATSVKPTEFRGKPIAACQILTVVVLNRHGDGGEVDGVEAESAH